ncbi:HAD family phosphatase [Methyloglobulus sp.]|uniref:HAD family hydrolase n=1 Tax=Methyloglobulus sp. TaxID=2518622 RepID=UPI0032B78F29
MPKLTDFTAFIFDMDGLVLDTEPTYFAAWQQAVTKMGYRLEVDAFKVVSGFHYQQVEAQILSWLGHDFDLHTFKRLGTECWRKYVNQHGIAVKSGVTNLLDYAQQHEIPFSLATNSSSIYAHECLTIAGLSHCFPLVVTGDDVRSVKPAPDIFLKAAERMQVDIQQCVIFEDSHTGIVAASASGAYTVYVPSTFPVNLQASALCNCQLENLMQALKILEAQR